MTRAIHELKNLGPKSEKMLAEIGVMNEAALRAIGALEAYRRLKFRFGREAPILVLYAMQAALDERDWRTLGAAARARLRAAAEDA